ncbi:MAG TPA: hypothetical protein VKA46_23255 [Gemmataceae bacterium]|nr:hypothetical protein [Gemmataceae bacterium]
MRRLLWEVRDRLVAKVFRETRLSPGWVLAICHPAHDRHVSERQRERGE